MKQTIGRWLVGLTLWVGVVVPRVVADPASVNRVSDAGSGTTIALPALQEKEEADPTRLRGWVVPKRRVTVSAPLGGVLMRVAVQEGQLVREGQVLAQLDHGMAQAAVEVAKLRAADDAPVHHARHTLRHAMLQFKSITQAYDSGAGSNYELNRAKLRRSQAQAAYQMAKNKQAIARSVLAFEKEKRDRHIVRAPFSGRVVRVFLQPGAMLRASEPLLKLVAMQTLEATVYVPAGLFGRFQVGRAYRLVADEPVNGPVTGTLQTVNPVIDPTRGAFRCVFTIANDGEALPAGFEVALDADPLERQSAVPEDAELAGRP